jgi:hypothetical protein
LQNGHPAACSDLDHANNHNVAALNPALPNPPLVGSPIETTRVQLVSLIERKRVSVQCACGVVPREIIDLEKSIYSLSDLVYELRDSDGDGTMAPSFVVNLNLAFERLIAQPLIDHFRTDSVSD